ncbi:tryptophan synthase alpha subunit [Candidatus Caldarchaeum subterraneum]|uniref:tryptophan synthase n=1 Tax=Caldiarchaeum subterraneum TaxID=311458 RepID=E6N6T1_CALS0|nr:tryptophan synthase alpha subunit [Candidatus Caldarchaeum subterraneum]BAJ50784.1 tryptophan synthase alpha subunit [Candidatus Caldarchaeum subterraneum]
MARLSEIAANKSLTIYLTLGYPSRDEMLEIVDELMRMGVDLLEFGIPYEAPKYDGPVIRRTHKTVLSNGFGYGEALGLLKEIKIENQFLLTYFELAQKIGVEKFFRELSETGVRAVLFPDLLIEYPEKLSSYDKLSDQYQFEKVYFVSSSFPHRMIAGLVDREPSFIYMGLMASTGVALPIAVRRNIAIIKGLLNDVPIIGGFAVRTAEQVRQYVDGGISGVVIGSAVASIIDNDNWRGNLTNLLNPILKALKQ